MLKTTMTKSLCTGSLAILLVLCATVLLPAVDDDPAAGQDRQEKKIYGKTPEELRPYSKFKGNPYKQFFVDPLEFTGPGRQKPEPEVETVKIGVLAPIEMSYETYIGRPILQGVQIAIDEANAAGGYKGKPFELVIRNDTGLWGASANEIVDLSYKDKVWAVIGTVDGANTHIAIRVALKTELPMMNVADLDATLVETKIPWIFRNTADDRQIAYTILYYVYKELGYNRVAILRANNRYGRIGVGEFRSGSTRLRRPAPIEINYELTYKNTNPEFTIQMERLERIRPEAVVLWADADAAGHIVKIMRERGLDIPVFACERIVQPRFLEIAGKAAEGVVAAYTFDPEADDAELDRFVRSYTERFGEQPDTYAAHAYDGTFMVIDAIRKAGLNRYRIRDALAALKEYEGVTGKMEFDAVYSDRSPVILCTVKDGKFVYNEPKPKVLF